MKRFLIFFTILCASLSCFAQGVPLRLELPSTQYSTELKRLMCDTDGFCILYPSYSPTDTFSYNIKQYDTQLKETFSFNTRLHNDFEFADADYSNGTVAIIFQKKIKKKYDTEGILILYDCKTHLWSQAPLLQLPTHPIHDFVITKGGGVFMAELDKRQSNLFFLQSGACAVHPLQIDNAPIYSISDFHEDTIQDKYFVLLNTNPHSNDNVLWLCETDLNGNPQYVIDLPDTGTVRFEDARLAPADSGRLLIIGNYVSRESNATGTFTLFYTDRTFSIPQLFPAQNIQQSAKTTSEISTLQSTIFHNNGKYAFVQEAYYPEYQYSTYYEYGVPTTEPVFIGYRFLWANVELFDSTGAQLWEYQFPYDNILLSNLTSHLNVCIGNEYILFYYLIGQQLCTMLTNDQLQIIAPKRITTLFANENKNEQLIYTTSLQPWYDDFFQLSGYRFNSKRGKNSNPIYFINKLRYQ